jgi:hypothetical protein
MARRFFAIALAVALGGWALSAQERATFVLTDGERVSGTLGWRGAMNGNRLVLAVPGRADRIFRNDEVAVIEFGGGWPRANELSALPLGGQMIALRNGETRVGYLLDIAGNTVRWQDERGATRDIALRDVARIFLNPRTARHVYSNQGYDARYRPDSSSSNTQGYASRYGSDYYARSSNQYGQNRSYRSSESIANPGNPIDIAGGTPWTDTGIDVMRGDALRFDAQGQVTFIHGATPPAGPAGGAPLSQHYPVRSSGVGALIGKVGPNGSPFLVGDNRNAISMPATGRLFLGINDDDFNDNSGSFRVTVIRGQ